MATGRALPPPSPFAGDDGAADQDLQATLTGFAVGSATLRDVVVVLAAARVLVPVLAELEACDTTDTGLVVDKEASAGVVALRTPDGRTALPVFSSVATMTAWRTDARPVPAQSVRAAASALQEGWELLVLDPGGPVTVVVPRPAVQALAAGAQWVPATGAGQVRSDVRAAVVAAVGALDHVVAVDAVPGTGAEVAVVLGLRRGLDRAGLDRLLAQVGGRLAADEVVTGAVDTLELRVTSV
ncbi:SseB family protein [Cellulomonas sp. KRMCY2]|uniref:SseB family protein n=1 Tax=Cellulomonas sp. KRMCY2 TaxID=1304865 RepID=UPI00045E5BA3|nr:SseB family protein [Cellulomonas sp. KRMCY2]